MTKSSTTEQFREFEKKRPKGVAEFFVIEGRVKDMTGSYRVKGQSCFYTKKAAEILVQRNKIRPGMPSFDDAGSAPTEQEPDADTTPARRSLRSS